jgi:hypothetical protein
VVVCLRERYWLLLQTCLSAKRRYIGLLPPDPSAAPLPAELPKRDVVKVLPDATATNLLPQHHVTVIVRPRHRPPA